MRLTTTRNGEHHVTIPDHAELRIGTLAAIVGSVAAHFDQDLLQIHELLFGGRRSPRQD
jgi:hypothetical protein